jgi:tetratricopeptide (TPR) repeat protein
MHYTKFLKWGILAGLVIALLVPFIVASGSWFPSMFFPYITGKNFTFRIIVEVIFGLYVLLALRDPKYRPKSSLLMWAACLFVAWVGLATLFSVDPVKSFWSNFERMDGYITVLHLFMYFIVASAFLTAEKWWEKFLQLSVGVSVIQGLLAVAQVFHIFGLSPSSQSGVRADGTFGNATYLAVYMLFNLFITLFLLTGLFKEKNAWRRSQALIWFYSIAAVLQVFAVFFTETRGAILGLVGGLIIAALYIVIKGRGLSRLSDISLDDSTTKARLFYIWPTAIEGAMEKPLFGWGQENFSYVFNKNYDPKMFGQEQWFDRAHNEFLDWMVAAGIPGFLFYLSLFVLAALIIIRSAGLSVPQQALLLALFAAYAFNNLFVFDNLISLVYFFTMLAFVHGMAGKGALPKWMILSKPADDKVLAIAAPIVGVLVVVGGWSLNAGGIARSQTLIEAIQPANPATGVAYTIEDRIAAFEKALAQGELGRQETVEQLYQFASNSVAPSPSISPDIKQKVYTLALEAGEALKKQRPNDARLELFTGVLYSQFGNHAAALAEYTKALEHSPNKQQILFQIGVSYLSQGDVQNALARFKQAFDLAPEYADARILYATGLYYAERDEEADQILTEGFGSVLYDDARLLQTYMSIKKYDRAIAIWQKRVEASPTNEDIVLGLAGTYFASGDTARTIETLRKISAMNPARTAEMESIISQIESGALKPQ